MTCWPHSLNWRRPSRPLRRTRRPCRRQSPERAVRKVWNRRPAPRLPRHRRHQVATASSTAWPSPWRMPPQRPNHRRRPGRSRLLSRCSLLRTTPPCRPPLPPTGRHLLALPPRPLTTHCVRAGARHRPPPLPARATASAEGATCSADCWTAWTDLPPWRLRHPPKRRAPSPPLLYLGRPAARTAWLTSRTVTPP